MYVAEPGEMHSWKNLLFPMGVTYDYTLKETTMWLNEPSDASDHFDNFKKPINTYVEHVGTSYYSTIAILLTNYRY